MFCRRHRRQFARQWHNSIALSLYVWMSVRCSNGIRYLLFGGAFYQNNDSQSWRLNGFNWKWQQSKGTNGDRKTRNSSKRVNVILCIRNERLFYEQKIEIRNETSSWFAWQLHHSSRNEIEVKCVPRDGNCSMCHVCNCDAFTLIVYIENGTRKFKKNSPDCVCKSRDKIERVQLITINTWLIVASIHWIVCINDKFLASEKKCVRVHLYNSSWNDSILSQSMVVARLYKNKNEAKRTGKKNKNAQYN